MSRLLVALISFLLTITVTNVNYEVASVVPLQDVFQNLFAERFIQYSL